MSPAIPTLLNICWAVFGTLLFLLPGLILALRLKGSAPLLSAFLGSCATLFNLVLLFDATGVPLHAGTIGLGLVATSAIFSWRMSRQHLNNPFQWEFNLRDWAWAWLIPPVFALGSVILRAVIDPLSGHDNDFRWDYLAQLFSANESLESYPPITAEDFEKYGWCDGIPPLVPVLNFWIYASAGSIAPALTAIRVAGEAILLGVVVYRFSCLLWGKGAGWTAIAALSSSSLLLWSVAIGQETGLTALSLTAMLYFLELHTLSKSKVSVFWSAVAGSVGALTREYGLCFPLLGIAVLMFRKEGRSGIPLFTTVSTGLVAPWYLRNWILTGNPVYPHTLYGIFPGNVVHDEVMQHIAKYWSFGSAPYPTSTIPLNLSMSAGVLILLGAFGAIRGRSQAVSLASGILLVAALWVWSIPQTAGGWMYSARVLSPALTLCAVLAGWITLGRANVRVVCATFVIVASVDAARRAWLLPVHVLASPWSTSIEDWSKTRDKLRQVRATDVWTVLVDAAGASRIVVDHPSHHATVTGMGGKAVPLFSPLLGSTFDDRTPFAEAVVELRKNGVRFVVLTLPSPITQPLIDRHPFWKILRDAHEPNITVGFLSVFDLEALVDRNGVPNG